MDNDGKENVVAVHIRTWHVASCSSGEHKNVHTQVDRRTDQYPRRTWVEAFLARQLQQAPHNTTYLQKACQFQSISSTERIKKKEQNVEKKK